MSITFPDSRDNNKRMNPVAKFNLLAQEIGTKVTCSKPSVDGYELVNLFTNLNHASDLLPHPKGFLAESFIKPPVNIVIELPLLVNLDRVLVNSKIGQQRSTGFELLTFSQNSARKEDIDFSIFTQVGRGFSNDKSLFCFVNSRFRGSSSFNNAKPMRSAFVGCDNKDIVTVEARHRKQKLAFVSHVMLRITSVSGCSACAIRTVEVWGEPSIYAEKAAIATFMTCYTSLTNQNMSKNVSREIQLENHNEESNNCEHKSLETGGEFPPDFLDPLTQELLVLPMLLPSGHVVDQSTLDKHSAAEAQWGRLPSDPFTGKTFSKGSAPIVHSKLKVRIDGFLLNHPELDVHSRTVGRINNSSCRNVVTSALVHDGTQPNQNRTSCGLTVPSGLFQGNRTKFMRTEDSRLNWSKRKLGSDEDVISKHHNAKKGKYIEYGKESKESSVTVSCIESEDKSTFSEANNTLSKSKHSGSLISGPTADTRKVTSCSNKNNPQHSSRLSSSLDSALSRTLAALPKFSSKDSSNEDSSSSQDNTNSAKDCVFCSRVQPGQMYSLNCIHLICRDCLVKESSGSIFCHQHKVITLQCDIVKVHLS